MSSNKSSSEKSYVLPVNASQIRYNPARQEGQTLHADEVRLLVDFHFVGFLIGKAGATARQIRESSGCTAINIHATDDSFANVDRLVTLRGRAEQTTKAIGLIADLIAKRSQSQELSTIISDPNRITIKILVHNRTAGAIIGKGGETINKTKDESKASISVTDQLPGSTDKVLRIQGSPASIELAASIIIPQQIANPPNNSPIHNFQPFASGSGQPVTISVSIPSNTVGLVIGKQGAVIRALSQESRAQITVPEKTSDDEYRTVLVVGPSRAAEHAVYLLNDIVKKHQNLE